MNVNASVLRPIYKTRKPESHKGDFGSVLVIGGSRIYSGSPALVAMAAMRAGADLTCIAAPERAAGIAASFSPDLITYPLKGACLSGHHLRELQKLLEKYDAVAIGNGLGLEPATKKAVVQFLARLGKPCVVDADAIKALDGRPLGENFVLTPHAVEFSILTGKPPGNTLKGRTQRVKAAAVKLRCTVLLKGHEDVISDGARTALNKTGNSFMTKGGTGDTLAGICAALLARGARPFEAACAAAYINGKAGDIAAERFGEGLLATDLLQCIPEAIRSSVRH